MPNSRLPRDVLLKDGTDYAMQLDRLSLLAGLQVRDADALFHCWSLGSSNDKCEARMPGGSEYRSVTVAFSISARLLLLLLLPPKVEERHRRRAVKTPAQP